jgi:hypothetical protein
LDSLNPAKGKIRMTPWKVLLPLAIATVFNASALAQSKQTIPLHSQAQDKKQAVVGNWEWTLSFGPMRKRVSMEVLEKEGKLTAIVELDDGTKLESKDFVLKDDRIQFSVRHELGGKAISMVHDGTLKGDKIIGTAKMNGGPMDMSSKWNASKITKKLGN